VIVVYSVYTRVYWLNKFYNSGFALAAAAHGKVQVLKYCVVWVIKVGACINITGYFLLSLL